MGDQTMIENKGKGNMTASRAYELAAAIEEVSNDVVFRDGMGEVRTVAIITLIGHAAQALVEYFDDQTIAGWKNGAEKHVNA